MALLMKSNLTESEFLNSLCVASTFDNNLAQYCVGKKVSISNSQGFTTPWIICGYNHDNTSGTFDLIAEKSVKDSYAFYDVNYNQNYEFSTIRTWLTGTYYNGFSTALKNRMSTMEVKYNFNTNQPNNQAYSNYPDTTGTIHTLNDKIKLLSGTELGYSGINYVPTNEGNKYPLFSSKTSNAANSEMIKVSGSSGSAINWWTRSRETSSSNGVWYVWTNGIFNGSTASHTYSIVPAIRVSIAS